MLDLNAGFSEVEWENKQANLALILEYSYLVGEKFIL